MREVPTLRALVALFAVFALIAAACGDDDDAESTETSEPTAVEDTASEPEPTEAPAVDEETPASADEDDAADAGSDDADTSSDDADTSSDDADTSSDDADTGSDDADTGSDDADTGSDDADTSSDDADTSSDDADTSSDDAGGDEVRAEIAESFVGATLAQHSGDPFEGEVSVYWNNGSNGTLIAIYHGSGMSDLEGLCPGNSLQTGSGFEHVTNTPAAPGACDDFPTPTSSLRVCTSSVVLYETAIPNDSEGTLWGSLEWRASDGAIVGMTSQALAVAGTPEIDYDADVYDISPMFTLDGSAEISCEPAVS